MKNGKRKQINRMEMEDDLGIKRLKKSRFSISLKTYKKIKLGLIIAIPAAFFIYSPLLILVFAAYFGLVFITHGVEKRFNAGLKKDLRTHLPKTDSILALLVIILTIVCLIVSSATVTQRKSQFSGVSSSDMPTATATFSADDFKWMQVRSTLQDLGSLMTGRRLFFTSSRAFGGFGGEPPERAESTDQSFKKPDMNDMLKEMPFSMIFSSIMSTVNTVLVFLTAGCGVIALLRVRKYKE